MADDSFEEETKNEDIIKCMKLFYKIKFLDSIANNIGAFGVEQGNETLLDKMDLTCGAVPEGNFDQVIDYSAPQQFLDLYVQIVENRFACAVTELLKMNDAYINQLKDYCYRVGNGMGNQEVENAQKAFEFVNSIVIDGSLGDETKELIENSENKVVWKKLKDSHKSSWEKAGGKLEIYYELQECFVNGLLSVSEINYSITNMEKFKLEKICSNNA